MQASDNGSCDEYYRIDAATREDIFQMSRIGSQGRFDTVAGRSEPLTEEYKLDVLSQFSPAAIEELRLEESWVAVKDVPSIPADADTDLTSSEITELHTDAEGLAASSQASRRQIIGWMTVMLSTLEPAILPARSYAAVDETVPHLTDLFVDQGYRGLGVGSELIRVAEMLVIDAGYNRLELAVLTENWRAQALYERLGYKVETEWTQRGTQEVSQLRSKKLDPDAGPIPEGRVEIIREGLEGDCKGSGLEGVS